LVKEYEWGAWTNDIAIAKALNHLRSKFGRNGLVQFRQILEQKHQCRSWDTINASSCAYLFYDE